MSSPREKLSRRQSSRSDVEPSVRVLMIEDDEYYFRFVRQLLKSRSELSFEVTHAGSLSRASQWMAWETPDVILLDLKLPDSDGLGSLSKVRQVCPDAPIVILTGSDDEQAGLEAMGLGAEDYLVKHRVDNDWLVRCLLYSIERRKSQQSILRLSTIRDFTSTLAHDLQIPLIGSRNVFEAILSGQFGQLDSKLEKVLINLQESNCKQLNLVQKLLEIYRYESAAHDFEFQAQNVRQLIDHCISINMARWPERPQVEVDLPDQIATVFGNDTALCHLFCNLLDNALRYGDHSRPAAVRGELGHDKVALYFHNFGPKIPDEVQRGSFEKFWQGVPGKTYVPNTGLGLYLCNRIVSLHRGRLTCTSTEDEGTTICVRLPIQP